MPDYKMDINGDLDLSDYSNIYDYIGVVDKNDNFTVTLKDKNEKNINIVTSMLRDSNFSILQEGLNDVGHYCISANKYK